MIKNCFFQSQTESTILGTSFLFHHGLGLLETKKGEKEKRPINLGLAIITEMKERLNIPVFETEWEECYFPLLKSNNM